MASSRGTDLSIARSSPSTSSTRAFRLRPSCHVGSIRPPRPGFTEAAGSFILPECREAATAAILAARGGEGMGKGAKIALGCGCLVLLAGAAVVGIFGVGAFWAKSKVTELTGGLDKLASKSRELESWEKKANANAYTAPADGVIAEDRFLKFLEARKRVFAVYQQYEPQFKELEAKSKAAGDKPSFTDAMNGVG